METLEEYFSTPVSAFLDDTELSPSALGRKGAGRTRIWCARSRVAGCLTLRSADRVLAFTSGFGRASDDVRDPFRRPGTGSLHRERGETRRSTAMTEQRTEPRRNPQIRFVRLPEMMAHTGLSRSTIDVRVAEGRFPKPVPLRARSVGDRVGVGRVAQRPDRGAMPARLGERAEAVNPYGWKGRKTEWIALVCLHSGVFTSTQATAFLEDTP